MKICVKCKINKSLIEFNKETKQKDGLRLQCKICRKTYHEARKNEFKMLYQINKEQIKAYKKIYNRNNKIKISTRISIYAKNNRGKINAKIAKYRISKTQATPLWLTLFQLKQIESIYRLASTLQRLNNIKYHVDHIVPLQGKTVSGLHVPWNLQILTAQNNISKSNSLPFK
ncbi:HNHc domain containing protein [uncultured Caudovirales phage]|uniref:HNHc domain containing protein n=1 Tax=uncultured Caudovirales phage TaxID=2100421 RepID=A0A6J5KX89_9CAUD|nr:HNHc domain containing protein [uncultured Caudovirales phage]